MSDQPPEIDWEKIPRWVKDTDGREYFYSPTPEDGAPWRPPALTADFGPKVCPECRDGKHPNCDGSSWCEATDSLADCPCGDLSHRGDR